MVKKIFVMVLTVAFIVRAVVNFADIHVAEAAGGRWRCVACWKLAISQYKPVDNTICPETGKKHRYIPSDE